MSNSMDLKSIGVSDQRSAPILVKNNLSLNACLPVNMMNAWNTAAHWVLITNGIY